MMASFIHFSMLFFFLFSVNLIRAWVIHLQRRVKLGYNNTESKEVKFFTCKPIKHLQCWFFFVFFNILFWRNWTKNRLLKRNILSIFCFYKFLKKKPYFIFILNRNLFQFKTCLQYRYLQFFDINYINSYFILISSLTHCNPTSYQWLSW